jgi:hypothetical protein
MADLTSKAELLEAIRIQRENIDRVVAEAGDRMEESGAMDDWTMKDVIAHLTGWRQNSVARMEAAVNDGALILPWTAGGDDDDYEPINQRIYATNRERPLADVLMDSRESFDRLEAAVSALSEDDLFTPGRYSWLDGAALGPAVIEGTVGHFHEEHESGIRAFLDR